MANHKSAEKRARQALKRQKRNSMIKSSVRTWEKKVRAAIAGGDKEGAQTLLRTYMSKIAKAAQKGVIHSRTASRKVSRISERVAKLVASAS